MSSSREGQAIGGTIASLISVSFLAVGGDVTTAALFSFSFAAIFLTTVVVLFWYASRLDFYRSYAQEEDPAAGGEEKQINLRDVLRPTWLFHLAAFLNFFVTLGVFPTYFSLAETTSSNEVTEFALPERIDDDPSDLD